MLVPLKDLDLFYPFAYGSLLIITADRDGLKVAVSVGVLPPVMPCCRNPKHPIARTCRDKKDLAISKVRHKKKHFASKTGCGDKAFRC